MEVGNYELSLLILVLIVNFSAGCKKASAPSTTTPAPPTYTTTEGILIVGGYGDKLDNGHTSVEVFIPGKRKSCKLPSLPYPRASSTVDIVDNTAIVCGGIFDINNETTNIHTLNSCLQLKSSGWEEYMTLNTGRYCHTSWVSKEGLILVGGDIMSVDREDDTELVKPGADPISFEVPWTRRACAINDIDSTIVTGNYLDLDDNGKTYYGGRKVVRYNIQGYVEDLPEMNQGRWGHGCGAYQASNSRVLIVAGGDSGNSVKSRLHKSTEKLVIGESSWTTVSNLPSRLSWVSSVSLDNTVFIIGGATFGNQYEQVYAYDVDEDYWREVGDMDQPRSAAAATKVDVPTIKHFCDQGQLL